MTKITLFKFVQISEALVITFATKLKQVSVLNYYKTEGIIMYMVTVKADKCDGCGECVSVCPVELFFLENGKAEINGDAECVGCESCTAACPNDAIRIQEL